MDYTYFDGLRSLMQSVIKFLQTLVIHFLSASSPWFDRQKSRINEFSSVVDDADKCMRMKAKHACAIVRTWVLQVGKILLHLFMDWLDCSIRGVNSLLNLESTSFSSVLWCSFLSILAIVGVTKMLIKLACNGLLTIFIDWILAILILAASSALIWFMCGSFLTDGVLIAFAGMAFAFSHELVALFVGTAYYVYQAHLYIGWPFVLLVLNLLRDIFIDFIRNYLRNQESVPHEHFAQSRSSTNTSPDSANSSPINDYCMLGLMKTKHLCGIIRMWVLHNAKILLPLFTIWLECNTSDSSSLFELMITCFFTILWCSFLSILAMVGVTKMLIILACGGLVTMFNNLALAILILAITLILLVFMYGSFWTTGVVIAFAGMAFAFSHERAALFVATAYSLYCVYFYVGLHGLFVGLYVHFILSHVLKNSTRNNPRNQESVPHEHPAQSQSSSDNFHDHTQSSPMNDYSTLGLLMKVKHLYAFIGRWVLHVGKRLLPLSMIWLKCTIRGFRSLYDLGTTSFFTMLWCSFLSILAMVGVIHMLVILTCGALVSIFIGLSLAVLVLAISSSLILFMYGSFWTTGMIIAFAGVAFAFGHKRVALFVTTAYSLYCARYYLGWIGLFVGLILYFILSDFLRNFIKNNPMDHLSFFHENFAEAQSSSDNFHDHAQSSSMNYNSLLTLLMKVEYLCAIIRMWVLRIGKILLHLSLVWLEFSIRGFRSLLYLGTSSFVTVIWCSFLSILAMVGVTKMLIILSCGFLVTSFIGLGLAILVLATSLILIFFMYGSFWTTGVIIAFAGIAFAFSHQRLALFVAIAYSLYCAYFYMGWFGLFVGLNMSFISSDILKNFIRNNTRDQESIPRGNFAESQSSTQSSTHESNVELTSDDEVDRLLNCSDHYAAFGFARYENIDVALLKREYRKKAMLVHPDKNMRREMATEAFKILQNAYEVLRDPVKQKAYDESLLRGDT